MPLTINRDVTLTTDLASLRRILRLEAILGLSQNHPDRARQRLVELGVSVNVRLNDDDIPTFTSQECLQTPFFTLEDLPSLPVYNNNAQNSRLSGNISPASRPVLSDYYGYSVTFQQWKDFDTTLRACDLPVANIPDDCEDWAEVFKNFLAFTRLATASGEKPELTAMLLPMQKVLEAFGYKAKAKVGSNEDAIFSTYPDEVPIMYTESKESTKLPVLTIQNGHLLCTYGFATKVVRTQWTKPDGPPEEWHEDAWFGNTFASVRLADMNLCIARKVSTSVKPSGLASRILRRGTEDITAKAAVKEMFTENLISSFDAVNLWGAVMQACHYSVANGKRMTIVHSARIWWFLELLSETNGNCVVHISEGRRLGRQGFLDTLVRFLTCAKDAAPFDALESRSWERALAKDRVSNKTNSPRKKRPAASQGGGNRLPPGQRGHGSSHTYGRVASLVDNSEEFNEKAKEAPTVSFESDCESSCSNVWNLLL